ncbi:hypothetical protein [Kitasatospora fiedleri]|uniref:hypothetical protein n=1 Tax=Kitasatospora fiedleri TaxID=2991545 RepID=UPI00249C84E0|nr:hypothetical protein [Kitasatospora fiedleri]
MSLFAPEGWRYWLWGAGLLVDALLLAAARGDDRERIAARWRPGSGGTRAGRGRTGRCRSCGEAEVDATHLGSGWACSW